MAPIQPAPADRQLPRGHLLVLNRSFRRTLVAENKSPRTIEAYTDAVRPLATYLQAHGRPLLAGQLQRDHLQAFIADQLARWKPATAHNRYRGLHAFFKWAVAEGDLVASPMDGMRPPQLPEQPVEVIRPVHLARLLRTCEGRDLASRRDTAVILLLVDTGMRRAECAGMTLDDVDLDQRIVWVLGRGRRPRALPIGRKTTHALDRYRRARDGHRLAHLPHLWVGRNGPMTPSGIYRAWVAQPGGRGWHRRRGAACRPRHRSSRRQARWIPAPRPPTLAGRGRRWRCPGLRHDPGRRHGPTDCGSRSHSPRPGPPAWPPPSATRSSPTGPGPTPTGGERW
jgi:integrase/recombinase XerC